MRNDCGFRGRREYEDQARKLSGPGPAPGEGPCDYPERCPHLRQRGECAFFRMVGMHRDIVAEKVFPRRPNGTAVVRAPRVAAAFGSVVGRFSDAVVVVFDADADIAIIPPSLDEWLTRAGEDVVRLRFPSAVDEIEVRYFSKTRGYYVYAR